MIKKSLLLFSVNITGRGFQYVYRVIMGYFLSLKEFGVLSASLPYLSFILLFTSMSVTPTVSKFTSQYRVKEKEKIFNVFSLLFLGLIAGGILYFSTGLLSRFFGPEFSEAVALLKVLSAAVPFAVLLCICTGIFLGYEKAEFMAFSLVVYQCIMVASSYMLVQYFGLNGATQGIFFAYVLSSLLACALVLRFGLPITIVLREIKKIFRFSLPVLTGVLGLWGILNMDTVVLARFATSEEVGLYGMAYPTARLIFGFSVALSALLLPRVSELKSRGIDPKNFVKSSFEVCTLVTLPISIALIAFSEEILYVLFGTPGGSTSLEILSVGMLFYSLFFVGYSALQGLGHPDISMGIAVASAVCNIILCFFLIPQYGLRGAALATSLSSGFGMILTLVILKTVFTPKIYYIVVMLPLFFFEHAAGILESRLLTMMVYGGAGLPFIVLYFYLSRKFLSF
jgi:stage V sporulation protein B